MTNWEVTLYKLFLGEQGTTTGHYEMAYTTHSISMAVFPAGASFNFGTLGYHTVYTSTGFTQYNVQEGDVVLDSFNKYYKIVSYKDWTIGSEVQFRECQLERMRHLERGGGSLEPYPLIDVSEFFGFEDESHGTVGGMFEDGFERGYKTYQG